MRRAAVAKSAAAGSQATKSVPLVAVDNLVAPRDAAIVDHPSSFVVSGSDHESSRSTSNSGEATRPTSAAGEPEAPEGASEHDESQQPTIGTRERAEDFGSDDAHPHSILPAADADEIPEVPSDDDVPNTPREIAFPASGEKVFGGFGAHPVGKIGVPVVRDEDGGMVAVGADLLQAGQTDADA